MNFFYLSHNLLCAFCRSLHHFYGGGNICDVTGQHRIVEVKMTLVNLFFYLEL